MPKAPGTAVTATSTIIRPWRLITRLYPAGPKIVRPVSMSSARMNMARSPAMRNRAMKVTPYWIPMTLWSWWNPK